MPLVRLLPTLLLLPALATRPAPAQVPFASGMSTRELAQGLQGAGSLAVDASGVVYAANLFDAQGPGQPTPVFRVFPDGTVDSSWTAPLVDPDVGVLDPTGTTWLIGSYGGLVTAVDLATGSQSRWVKDARLGNVDGLAFLPSGDLLVSAIDHSLIHRVDGTTRAVTVFADLGPLGMQGFGSLAVDPASGAVFVATPLDGFLVSLRSDGSVDDPAYAQGFLHMGQLLLEPGRVLVSDNAAGIIHAVDRTSRQVLRLVHRVAPLAAGLAPLGNGSYVASRLSADSSQGTLYCIEPFQLDLPVPARVASASSVDVTSVADAGRRGFLLLSDARGPTTLPDGRILAMGFGNWLWQAFTFDASGAWSLGFTVPNDPSLAGFTVFSAAVSLSPDHPGLHGLSGGLSFTIQP